MGSEQGLVRVWKTKRIQQILTSHLENVERGYNYMSSSISQVHRLSPTQAMTFKISHDKETFLPPILDPIMGTEQTFTYTVQRCQLGSSSSPVYGSRKMAELLVKQYPPMFHASINIPHLSRRWP